MRTLVVAGYAPELKTLPKEVEEITSTLQALGPVRLLLEVDSLDQLMVLDEQYDLVWIASHSNKVGVVLGALVISPDMLAQLLSSVQASSLVLNSCFSAEHVSLIQRGYDLEIVATIDPMGVQDSVAWLTGVFLARALVRENGDLQKACVIATASGSAAYRYFPAGNSHRSIHSPSSEETLHRIRLALEGDPLSTQPGLVRSITILTESFDSFRVRTENRLLSLEGRATGWSPKLTILIVVGYVLLLLFLLYLSLRIAI